MSLKKREQINLSIPAYHKTAKLAPFKLENVGLSDLYIEVNDRTWTLSETDIIGCTLVLYRSNGYNFQHIISITPEVAFQKLISEYLRNGTRIKKFHLYALPSLLKNVELHVSELKIDGCDYETFAKFRKFIDHNQKILKEIGFVVRQNTLWMFDEQLVKNSKEIYLQFPYYNPVPLDDMLLRLKNNHVHIIYLGFPIEKLQELAMNWIDTKKPIGTSLFLVVEHYTYVIDVFEHLTKYSKAIPSRLTDLGTSFFSHCVTMHIDESSELVLFGGPMVIEWKPFKWTLRMTIMKRGSTISK